MHTLEVIPLIAHGSENGCWSLVDIAGYGCLGNALMYLLPGCISISGSPCSHW